MALKVHKVPGYSENFRLRLKKLESVKSRGTQVRISRYRGTARKYVNHPGVTPLTRTSCSPLILLKSSPPPRSTSHNTCFLKHVVDDLLSVFC